MKRALARGSQDLKGSLVCDVDRISSRKEGSSMIFTLKMITRFHVYNGELDLKDHIALGNMNEYTLDMILVVSTKALLRTC